MYGSELILNYEGSFRNENLNVAFNELRLRAENYIHLSLSLMFILLLLLLLILITIIQWNIENEAIRIARIIICDLNETSKFELWSGIKLRKSSLITFELWTVTFQWILTRRENVRWTRIGGLCFDAADPVNPACCIWTFNLFEGHGIQWQSDIFKRYISQFSRVFLSY